jgi:excisionase family DNA binding protein
MSKSAPPAKESAKPARELPNLRSSKWVAEKLGVSVASVQRLALSGQIASLKVGGQRKFAEHDVWVYLTQLRKEAERLATLRNAALQNTVPAPPPDTRQLPLDTTASE